MMSKKQKAKLSGPEMYFPDQKHQVSDDYLVKFEN